MNHSEEDYAHYNYRTGETATTNTVEGFFGNSKRSLDGTHHQISRQHLHLYTAELDFKYNTRKSSDGERTAVGIRRIEGKRLMLLAQSGNLMAQPRVSEVRTEHLLTRAFKSAGLELSLSPPKTANFSANTSTRTIPISRDVFLHRQQGRRKMIGHGLPEAGVVVGDRQTMQPILVIEAKASVADLNKAVREATEIYGNACIDAGYSPLAVAIAGTSEDEFAVRVFKWNGRRGGRQLLTREIRSARFPIASMPTVCAAPTTTSQSFAPPSRA